MSMYDNKNQNADELVEGFVVEHHPDGLVVTRHPDGLVVEQHPDGRVVERHPDARVGDNCVVTGFIRKAHVRITHPDGRKEIIHTTWSGNPFVIVISEDTTGKNDVSDDDEDGNGYSVNPDGDLTDNNGVVLDCDLLSLVVVDGVPVHESQEEVVYDSGLHYAIVGGHVNGDAYDYADL